MNLILFITFVIVSFIVVRVGAIAFHLTGLEWSQAKFQALSCFSGTGFTTKEAELITMSRQRRRIATVLIVLGNAGLVTMIATFANTISPRDLGGKLSLPFLGTFGSARWLPWINLLVVIVAIYLIWKVFTNSKFTRKLTQVLRDRMQDREIVKAVGFEELLLATGGYGVSRVDISAESPMVGKVISQSGLRSLDINLLAIIREGKTIVNPAAATEFLLGDELICFGKLKNIRRAVCGPKENEQANHGT